MSSSLDCRWNRRSLGGRVHWTRSYVHGMNHGVYMCRRDFLSYNNLRPLLLNILKCKKLAPTVAYLFCAVPSQQYHSEQIRVRAILRLSCKWYLFSQSSCSRDLELHSWHCWPVLISRSQHISFLIRIFQFLSPCDEDVHSGPRG